MMSQVLAHFHLPFLSCLGLLLFLTVFVGSVLWVYREDSRAFYEQVQNFPFDEEKTS